MGCVDHADDVDGTLGVFEHDHRDLGVDQVVAVIELANEFLGLANAAFPQVDGANQREGNGVFLGNGNLPCEIFFLEDLDLEDVGGTEHIVRRGRSRNSGAAGSLGGGQDGVKAGSQSKNEAGQTR